MPLAWNQREPGWWSKARDLAAAGHSRKEIAATFDRTTTSVARALKKGRPGRTSSNVNIVPIAYREIKRLHAMRVGRTKIAALLRIPYAQIEAALKNHGVSE